MDSKFGLDKNSNKEEFYNRHYNKMFTNDNTPDNEFNSSKGNLEED